MIFSRRAGASTDQTYSVGSLVYTRAGLLSLFGWLLWGDFILTLMEQVMPSLLPLILKTHGASNHELIFITSTLYLAMNSALNPVISYQSDRFRSRWGRRRPFIAVTTPLVVLFLVAVPFAPEILSGLKSIGPIDHRCFLLWNALFAVVALVAIVVVYRRWKALGGLTSYSPP